MGVSKNMIIKVQNENLPSETNKKKLQAKMQNKGWNQKESELIKEEEIRSAEKPTN